MALAREDGAGIYGEAMRHRPDSSRRSAPRERALYVEILIRAPLDVIWDLTQDPDAHVRWDARFTSIVPLREREDGAQEFAYALNLRVHTIRGTGVSLGTRVGRHGERTSALLFSSSDPLTPLADGRGYWRYIPTDEGVRFLTGYDYRPGWGALGRAFDPFLVRPYVWWLTAHSFDRLRMWAEDGVVPERTSWWRSLLPGARPRARARRCLSRPPGRTARPSMAEAPESLARISS